MKSIKIKATNIEDFKKQYFDNGDFDVENSLIQLETSDEFWREISGKEIKEVVANIHRLFPDDSKNKFILKNFNKCNFSRFYLPRYGHIERIIKSEKGIIVT